MRHRHYLFLFIYAALAPALIQAADTPDDIQTAFQHHDLRALEDAATQGDSARRQLALKDLIFLNDPQVIPFLRMQLDSDDTQIVESTLWGLPSFGAAANTGDLPDKVKSLQQSGQFGLRRTAEVVASDLQNMDEYLRMKSNLSSTYDTEQEEALQYFVKRKDLSILLYSRTLLQQADGRQRLLGVKLTHELDDRDMLQEIHKLLSDPVPAIRAESAKIVTDWEGNFSVGLLKPLLHDPNPAVRGIVILSLGKISDPVVSKLLAGCRKDKALEVRIALAKALGGFASPESTAALMDFAMDENIFIYEPAIDGLVGFKNPAVEKEMNKYFDDKSSRKHRRAALLYFSDPRTVVDPMKLVSRLHDTDDDIRRIAVEGIFRLPGAKAKSHLIYCLDDKSPKVRNAVLQQLDALFKIPDLNKKQLRQKLETLSKDKDPQVQALAIQGLAKLK